MKFRPATATLCVMLASCEFIPGTDAHKISEAEGLASAYLKDPATAQFRNMRVVSAPASVCGEINGKNLLGAYTGFRKLVVVEGVTHIDLTPWPEFMAGDKPPGHSEEMAFMVSYTWHCRD